MASGAQRQGTSHRPGISFTVGSFLDAKDSRFPKMERWYKAQILRINNSSKMVLVHFVKWKSKWDHWVSMDSDFIRPCQDTASSTKTDEDDTTFKLGDSILGKWHDDQFYSGTIEQVLSARYFLVRFYDGYARRLSKASIKYPPEGSPLQTKPSDSSTVAPRQLDEQKAKELGLQQGSRERKRFSIYKYRPSDEASPVKGALQRDLVEAFGAVKHLSEPPPSKRRKLSFNKEPPIPHVTSKEKLKDLEKDVITIKRARRKTKAKSSEIQILTATPTELDALEALDFEFNDPVASPETPKLPDDPYDDVDNKTLASLLKECSAPGLVHNSPGKVQSEIEVVKEESESEPPSLPLPEDGKLTDDVASSNYISDSFAFSSETSLPPIALNEEPTTPLENDSMGKSDNRSSAIDDLASTTSQSLASSTAISTATISATNRSSPDDSPNVVAELSPTEASPELPIGLQEDPTDKLYQVEDEPVKVALRPSSESKNSESGDCSSNEEDTFVCSVQNYSELSVTESEGSPNPKPTKEEPAIDTILEEETVDEVTETMDFISPDHNSPVVVLEPLDLKSAVDPDEPHSSTGLRAFPDPERPLLTKIIKKPPARKQNSFPAQILDNRLSASTSSILKLKAEPVITRGGVKESQLQTDAYPDWLPEVMRCVCKMEEFLPGQQVLQCDSCFCYSHNKCYNLPNRYRGRFVCNVCNKPKGMRKARKNDVLEQFLVKGSLPKFPGVKDATKDRSERKSVNEMIGLVFGLKNILDVAGKKASACESGTLPEDQRVSNLLEADGMFDYSSHQLDHIEAQLEVLENDNGISEDCDAIGMKNEVSKVVAELKEVKRLAGK